MQWSPRRNEGSSLVGGFRLSKLEGVAHLEEVRAALLRETGIAGAEIVVGVAREQAGPWIQHVAEQKLARERAGATRRPGGVKRDVVADILLLGDRAHEHPRIEVPGGAQVVKSGRVEPLVGDVELLEVADEIDLEVRTRRQGERWRDRKQPALAHADVVHPVAAGRIDFELEPAQRLRARID